MGQKRVDDAKVVSVGSHRPLSGQVNSRRVLYERSTNLIEILTEWEAEMEWEVGS